MALISMLLLNFATEHIQWCIHTMAMTFGIAIYAFIIFFALKVYLEPKDKLKYIPFLLVFLYIIVWTHTISAFITLVSLLALVVGYILYEILNNQNIYNWNILPIRSQSIRLLMVPLVFLAVIITYHWMDPAYPFFDKSFGGLFKSLSQEAEIFGATTLSNVQGRWEQLLHPIGFYIYVFFGIIGALYCSSHKEQAKKYFPLIVLVLGLFFVLCISAFWNGGYCSLSLARICVCLFRFIRWIRDLSCFGFAEIKESYSLRGCIYFLYWIIFNDYTYSSKSGFSIIWRGNIHSVNSD